MIYKKPLPHSVAEDLSNTRDKIVGDLHDLRDNARRLKTDLRDAAHVVIGAPGSFVHKVQSKPIQSTLIAIGVGWIIGRLYRS